MDWNMSNRLVAPKHVFPQVAQLLPPAGIRLEQAAYAFAGSSLLLLADAGQIERWLSPKDSPIPQTRPHSREPV